MVDSAMLGCVQPDGSVAWTLIRGAVHPDSIGHDLVEFYTDYDKLMQLITSPFYVRKIEPDVDASLMRIDGSRDEKDGEHEKFDSDMNFMETFNERSSASYAYLFDWLEARRMEDEGVDAMKTCWKVMARWGLRLVEYLRGNYPDLPT